MKKGLLLMLSIILMLTMCKKKEEISDMRRRGD